TARAAMIAGLDANSTVKSALWTFARMKSLSIQASTTSAVTQDQAVHQPRPAINGDEKEQFQRDRDEDRRNHDHAERHQDVRDNDVDDEEGKVEQEADLKRALKLGGDKGGNKDGEIVISEILACLLRPQAVGSIKKELSLFQLCEFDQVLLQRLPYQLRRPGKVVRCLELNLPVLKPARHLAQQRCRDVDGEHERSAVEHKIGWRLFHAVR